MEVGGVAIYRPFGEFHRTNSYCRLTIDSESRNSEPQPSDKNDFKVDTPPPLQTSTAHKQEDFESPYTRRVSIKPRTDCSKEQK
ncbi:hypothetical protein TNCV_5132501 [Trichonephila clavipes]|nr:hypothetical protein TNCV_5132501 [Trichonephila clavipes]